MEALHYYNEKYLKKNEISISPDDVGFTRAHAVFEYFRVENAQPIFMQDHLDRLWRSASGLNINIPKSREELIEIINELVASNGLESSAIKIMVTGGVSTNGFSPGEPTLLVMNLPFQSIDQKLYENGASVMVYEYQRDLPSLKSVEYAQALALEAQWKSEGHIDVLYHQGGIVSEVSRSSVFIVKDGAIKTNKVGVLAGVTQKNVIRAIGHQFPVEIGEITLNELIGADEFFITSTSKRVLPIVKVENELIGDGKPGKVSRKIKIQFEDYIKGLLN